MLFSILFYVFIAFIALYFVQKNENPVRGRKRYNSAELLALRYSNPVLPSDWDPPVWQSFKREKKQMRTNKDRVKIKSEDKENIDSLINKIQRLEIRRLGERTPFEERSRNCPAFNPSAPEFVPGLTLNPEAKTFSPIL